MEKKWKGNHPERRREIWKKDTAPLWTPNWRAVTSELPKEPNFVALHSDRTLQKTTQNRLQKLPEATKRRARKDTAPLWTLTGAQTGPSKRALKTLSKSCQKQPKGGLESISQTKHVWNIFWNSLRRSKPLKMAPPNEVQ